MIAACGGVLILLSGLFAILGTMVGTCTMGSADELAIGGMIAAVGYGVGIALLVARPPSPIGWALLSPVIAVVAIHTYLAAGFFIAYRIHSLSACAWKTGILDFETDGREPWLTALWLGECVFALAGFAAVWLRGRRLRRA